MHNAIRISETNKTRFVFSTTNMNGNQGSVELPPNFKPCSLKGRPFTPTFDTSCHNTQGIDVWANKGPRPYAPGKSSTLPRKTHSCYTAGMICNPLTNNYSVLLISGNLGQARAGGQLPPAVAQAEKKLVSSSQEVKTSQQTTTVTSSSQQVVQETSSSSMTAVSASSQEIKLSLLYNTSCFFSEQMQCTVYIYYSNILGRPMRRTKKAHGFCF